MILIFLFMCCMAAVSGQYYQYSPYQLYAAKTYTPPQQFNQYYQLNPQQFNHYQQMQHRYQQEYAKYLYNQQLQAYHQQQHEYARHYYYQQQQTTAAPTTQAPTNYWKSLGYGSDDKGNVWLGDDIAKISIIAKTSWP